MSRLYQPSLLVAVAIAATLSLTHSPGLQAHSDSTAAQLAAQTESPRAPLFDNLGGFQFPVSTDNPLVQRYVDQGMTLAYGFNHAEAARSFQAAASLDPTCAMCQWGLAYVLGPNINAAMEDAAVPTAYEAIQRAIALQDQASDRERAYIQALAQRYAAEPGESRRSLDLAYAEAMERVAQQYPDDLDAQALYVEALMDTMPWDYWLEDGSPKPETVEMMRVLEAVLERQPDHIGALHLYIHVVEKERPELGVEAADRLGDLVPGAGHLVHMPAHIYLRVGRYQDAITANLKATEADRDYITQCHAQGLYPLALVPHNHHFLLFAAIMAGQQQVAIDAAHHTADLANPELMREPGYGTLQHYATMPLYTWVKFEQWDAILAAPAPASDLAYPTGVWHFARGMALAHRGQFAAAEQELAQLEAIAQSPALGGVTIWDINSTVHLMQIAVPTLGGELAAQQGDLAGAIAQFQQAVAQEDALAYDEPNPWALPVRHYLGAALLAAGQAAAAEQTYRQDLSTYPENGWSLHGLAQSLRAQGKPAAAAVVEARFATAWGQADFTLSQR